MKIISLICILILVSACFRPAKTATNNPPNVVFIICDDLNISLGCYGHSYVKTPNIDQLANQGVRFDAAYAAFTLCNPARTSVLSGLTPQTTGIENNSTKPIGFTWMPDYFKRAGYHTGVIGKVTHGAFSDIMTADDYATADEIGGFDYAAACPSPDFGCAVKIKDKLDLDARIAKHAVKFLRKAEGPFFLAVGFSKPHAPNWGPQKYFDQYNLADIPLPVPIGDDGMTDDQRRQARLSYYACVSFVDAQLGILLDTLEELGLRENTIIVFSGDHGYLLGEHGVWNKHELYDLTSRVPLIVTGPGIIPGVAAGIVEHVDVLPTLLDLCGATGGPFEGVSFAPLLSNPNRPWKTAAFTESIADKKSTVDHAVYTDRYTYVEGESGTRLFDRMADPHETVNNTDPSMRSAMHDILTAGWRQALPR